MDDLEVPPFSETTRISFNSPKYCDLIHENKELARFGLSTNWISPGAVFLSAHNPKMVVRIFGLNGGYDWQFQRKGLVIHGGTGAQCDSKLQSDMGLSKHWVPEFRFLACSNIYDDVHHFRWTL